MGVWKSLGRDKRYLGTAEENTLTFAVEAAKQVLRDSGINGNEIDVIVVSSGTHEYSIPTDAAFVHKAIGGKSNCAVYDQNANCVGMIVAYDHLSRSILHNRRVKYALLIGSEQLGGFYNEEDLIHEGLSGDAACAVLLERTEEDGYGLIDSAYFTSSDGVEGLLLPDNGFKRSVGNKVHVSDSYNVDIAFPEAISIINTILSDNNYSKADVSHYLVSQLFTTKMDYLVEALEEDRSKFTYVGDKYAYTGTTSPFLALYHAVQDGKLRKGDLFVMWSVGAGITSCGLIARL